MTDVVPLVLRYPTASVAITVMVCLGAGVVMFFIPVGKPADRALFVGLGLIDFVLTAILAWFCSIRIVVDAGGVERRRVGRPSAKLAWGDVGRVTTWMGESVRLVGSGGGPTIWVSSGLAGFPAFLDRIESRPEYDRWISGVSDPGELGPGVTAVFRRPGPVVGLAVVAAGLWTLAIVFLLRPGMFQGWRGDDPRAELFNLAFIDRPALGQALLVVVALGATFAPLAFWHTLRVEHDGIELEFLTRTRSIPFGDVAGLDLKIDRGRPTDRVRSFDHVLSLRSTDDRSVKLVRGEKASCAREAIDRGLRDWRARGAAVRLGLDDRERGGAA